MNPRKWFVGKQDGKWCALHPERRQVALFNTWRDAYDYADSQVPRLWQVVEMLTRA